ncbi:LSU ribosomal protein L3P [Chthonomonas calidirosea]|uniref:Large ribosomal subunit protein uL3 n=1 Tax=Chthonomonas calidirosea (strain DSM 23976 / ICMP 18418 / T49) TaxID=1303518 RepID=S0EZV8_CHTCT|nr:50S ribosomal protein L3 [Chthonomonas calidirosea]CCW36647.1 LSU ribosomal protein L3P [Chthonomonas calidirosea T49]CEK15603.1 LSU ribosomal protein L3P [Chthonomonas calidirosea]CEK15605.1 LSU ribosomal protein L3P [Chthonomonas calidirosea]CEK16707.1 LSU ribosomal protein L3P [Chthonomonas calidirosea]
MVDTILGRKIGMTQIFNENGEVVPVTVIEAGPCIVTQLKSVETDGYTAIQVGFGEVSERHVNRPLKGHFQRAGVAPTRYLREIRTDNIEEYKVGDSIRCDIFRPGMRVKVTGISKGKGFQGVVKRFHFHGADMTHGSMIHRKPQSSGATDAARTFKGTKKPGHMGAKQVTVRGLQVVRVDVDRNLIFIKGAVPGAEGELVRIQRLPIR